MSEPNSTSGYEGHSVDPWALSEGLSFFYDYIRKLTTTSSLNLTQVLCELRQRSTADGIFLFSRGDNLNGNAIIKWSISASSVIDQDRWEWNKIEDKEGKGAIQLLLNYIVEQARRYKIPDVKAEFTPSWASDLSSTRERVLAAFREIQDLEQKKNLNKVQNELKEWGPVCGFPLGHVMIGEWQLGETVLLMVRLMKSEDAGRTRFFNDTEKCLITFLVYLAETNSHLFRKRSLERLPILERQRRFNDEVCAAAYVRGICRLAPLWKEHPEVGLEVSPGITIESLALIRKNHGTKKEVFTMAFTLEDAIREIEEVQKAWRNG